MGRLVEQPIKALFNGVSRQPHNVRLSSQVQESNNTLLSVVTGGFEKRPASQRVATVTGLATTGTFAVHTIDRDPTEQYVIIIDNAGVIKVWDVVNNIEKTVNSYASSLQTYVTSTTPRNDLAFVTIADFTFIVNRTITSAMQAATADTLNGGINDAVTTITVDSTTGFPSVGSILIDNEVIAYTGTTSTQFTGCSRAQRSTSAASHSDGAAVVPTVAAFVDAFSDLAAGGANGVHGVTNSSSTLDDFFVTFNSTTQAWEETVEPGLQNSFDPATMPHQFVRQADGTWTLSQVSWESRAVGNLTTVPNPQFIGRKINDVFFFRNRLGLLADENVFFSQSGSFFNLWPDKATEVLDTDPIDVAASTTKVTLLRWAIPFRKSLFLSADRAQFELSTTGTLTPASAIIDLATNYSTSNYTRPVALGDELYFAGKSGDKAIIYEYFVEDDTLTNVAVDVTKHAEGYVPAEVVMMAGDPTTGRLFCHTNVASSSGDFDELYVYSVYFDGNEKAQSAWTKWDLNCTKIMGLGVVEGHLFLVLDRNGTYVLEKIPLLQETADTSLGHSIMLDGRTNVSGSYSSGTDRTSWTLPYAHRSVAEAVLPSTFTDLGKKLSLEYGGQASCTITVTDGLNIAPGTTITITDNAGVSTTMTGTATNPTTNPNEFSVGVDNASTADNIAVGAGGVLGINALSGYTAPNPAANVITVTRTDPGNNNLTVVSSDPTRITVTNFTASATLVTATGDYSANAVTFGIPYDMLVELSKQYVREQDNTSIISGRFQLRDMKVYFTDTGFFQALVTPENRDSKTFTMTGRILGSASNIVGKPAMLTDVWRFPVRSRGDRVKIEFKNSSHLPCVINSVSSIGYFNEITRQD